MLFSSFFIKYSLPCCQIFHGYRSRRFFENFVFFQKLQKIQKLAIFMSWFLPEGIWKKSFKFFCPCPDPTPHSSHLYLIQFSYQFYLDQRMNKFIFTIIFFIKVQISLRLLKLPTFFFCNLSIFRQESRICPCKLTF